MSLRVPPLPTKSNRQKVERRLIPVLAVLYAIAFINATNLAVARHEGADRDFVRSVYSQILAIHDEVALEFARGPSLLYRIPCFLPSVCSVSSLAYFRFPRKLTRGEKGFNSL